MKRSSRFRIEKSRLLRARDAALGPRRRLEVAADQMAAARELFMAGLAEMGFSREEALREWRRAPSRSG